jgi:hypothetical protein
VFEVFGDFDVGVDAVFLDFFPEVFVEFDACFFAVHEGVRWYGGI